MCLTSGISVWLSFGLSDEQALRLAGAKRRGVVDQPTHLFGNSFGELGDRLAVLGSHRLPESDIYRLPAASRPVLAIRHGLGRTDDGNREARHISADA